MKFWQKIFIYSLLLFLIVFNLGVIFFIENSSNLSLKREINRSLTEHKTISEGLDFYNKISNTYVYENTSEFNTYIYEKSIQNYFDQINYKDIYLEVLDKENNVIFNNLPFKIPEEREELQDSSTNRQYIIRDVENRTLLFISGLVRIQENDFKLSYIRDVTYIYQDKEEQYNFFIKISFIVTLILAVGMYFLSKYITRPIYKLVNSVKKVSNGEYSERVDINCKDEVGILAKNFNEMANSIDEKVNELQIKAEEKQRFIDNFTHELKTPLTSIIAYADFLRSTEYKEEISIDGLTHILKEAKRLEKLSWKMMDLILLKRDNFIMKKENTHKIFLDIKEHLNPKLQKKNIKLSICNSEYEILVERDLIRNLISNLIDNSIKASKENSTIYLNVYKNAENKIVIEVKDEGIGIAEKDISKVFEAFYVVDKSRTRANNGAGLGLSICAEIAKVHNATLEIESKVYNGTTIKLIFN